MTRGRLVAPPVAGARAERPGGAESWAVSGVRAVSIKRELDPDIAKHV